MTEEETRKARDLVATVGNPQGLYAEEVMRLFNKALDGCDRYRAALERIIQYRGGLQAHEDSEPLRQVVQLAFLTLNSNEGR